MIGVINLKLKHIDNGKNFDFGNTSKEYAKYRDIYPEELYEELYSLGIGHENTTWLDMGTGTGVIPFNLCKFGADIKASDISENQISTAKGLLEERNISNIEFLVSKKMKLRKKIF